MPVVPLPPRPRKSSDFPAVPLVGLLVVVALAVWVGNAARQSQETAEAAASEKPAAAPDPFAAIPDELAPTGSGRSGSGAGSRTGSGPRAPESALTDASWVSAKQIADKAYEYAQAARTAKENKDESEYSRLSELVRQEFDRALEQSAVFEEELMASYGDGDPVVEAVKKTRSRWFDQVRKVRGVK